MDLSKWLNDDRLLANLIGIHIVLAVMLMLSVLMRRTLKSLSEQLARWTGIPWLDFVGKEAGKGMRAVLFWSTIGLMLVSIASMGLYHLSGRDLRSDIKECCADLTRAHLVGFGIVLGKLVLLAVGTAIGVRLVRRGRISLEMMVHHYLPRHVQPEAAPAPAAGNILPFPPAGSADPPKPAAERRENLEETVRRWFTLLERFGTALGLVAAFWLAGRIVGVPDVDIWAHRVFHIIAYFMVARLLTLGCRTMFHVFADIGNRQFDKGAFHRYWERVVRLFPLGERCFEAAVWIFAAARCCKTLDFIEFVYEYGDDAVKCIGIFFLTRVGVELLHVFINQAFGMYQEMEDSDQKGQTLVPLLESLSRYVIYFGSALMMLRVFQVDTTPILAGAGVVGLAVGLGAQNFVTDLVSGFFILFETQYLVGDFVQIGDAIGKVEEISIRTTQIRDESGKLVIIPNGQIKTVVNFSKGYVNAIVDIKVPTTTNLDQVMQDMAEAGRRLKARHKEVQADTAVKGLVDLSPGDMTIRAVTKVQPGTHLFMQQEYRKALKEVFDERARGGLKALAA